MWTALLEFSFLVPALSGCLKIGFKKETLKADFFKKGDAFMFEHVEEKNRNLTLIIVSFSDESTWFGGREKQGNSQKSRFSP